MEETPRKLAFLRDGKIVHWALSIAALAALATSAFLIAQPLTLSHIAHAGIVTTPFTQELEAYNFETNPSGELILRKTLGRRTDGATVTIEPLFGRAGLQNGDRTRGIKFLDGRKVTVYESVSALVRWPRLSEKAVAILKQKTLNPPKDCLAPNETLIGSDTVLGYTTNVVKWTQVVDEQSTAWRAPELGCVMLRYKIEKFRADGSRSVITEGKTVSLTLGEPNAALFEIPEKFESVKPSEAAKREMVRLGVAWPKEFQKEADRLDAEYAGTLLARQPQP